MPPETLPPSPPSPPRIERTAVATAGRIVLVCALAWAAGWLAARMIGKDTPRPAWGPERPRRRL